MTAPSRVIWAKPANGIIAPSAASDTPAAWTAAAAAVVRGGSRRRRRRAVVRAEGARSGWRLRMAIRCSFGGAAAPGAPLTLSTNTDARIDS